MAVTLRYFTEFGKPALQKAICDWIYARVYCIFQCVYNVLHLLRQCLSVNSLCLSCSWVTHQRFKIQKYAVGRKSWKFWQFFRFFGPETSKYSQISVKFGTVALPRAKFHANPWIVSPLRDEKPQNRLLINCNTGGCPTGKKLLPDVQNCGRN